MSQETIPIAVKIIFEDGSGDASFLKEPHFWKLNSFINYYMKSFET